METRTDLQSLPSHTQQSWYEEFGLIPRFPRIPFDEIYKLVSDTQEPQVFLRRAGKGMTDITIRLPITSSVVPGELQKQYSNHGITLAKAFEDVLWQKLGGEQSTAWASLAGLASKTYRQAWIQWFKLQYLSHYHPAADKMFKANKEKIESGSKAAHRGRKASTRAEHNSLRQRYDRLLPKCALIHRAAIRAAASSHIKNNQVIARKEIRKTIWETVRRSVHGMPGDGYIFDGEGFKRIPYGKPKLHDPATWEPHQLAISLLTFERGQAYQTIEKKIVPTKYKQ